MIKFHLSRPFFDKNEEKIVKKAIKNTWVSTSGPQVKIFEKNLSDFLNVKYAVATNSGTSALHLALLSCSVSKGDEVIAPSLTFIATVNAIKYAGAEPIFFDSDDFYNIKISDVIKFLDNECFYKRPYTYNKKTKKIIKAIVLVHVWGNAVNINKQQISDLKKRGIKIIEDATESLGTYYKSKQLKKSYTGTLGDVGCFSFNGNKIITTGSGGALVTNNLNIYKYTNHLSSQAKSDSLFFIHNKIGYNYKMSNISASLGIAQLDKFSFILNKKIKIYQKYIQLFESNSDLSLMVTPGYAYNNHWMNLIIFKKKLKFSEMKNFIKKMEKRKIQIRPVWKLNHLQQEFKKCQKYQIKNSLNLYHKSLCIPSDINLSDKDIKYIFNNLK